MPSGSLCLAQVLRGAGNGQSLSWQRLSQKHPKKWCNRVFCTLKRRIGFENPFRQQRAKLAQVVEGCLHKRYLLEVRLSGFCARAGSASSLGGRQIWFSRPQRPDRPLNGNGENVTSEGLQSDGRQRDAGRCPDQASSSAGRAMRRSSTLPSFLTPTSSNWLVRSPFFTSSSRIIVNSCR